MAPATSAGGGGAVKTTNTKRRKVTGGKRKKKQADDDEMQELEKKSFMDLPPELRNIIYEEVINGDHGAEKGPQTIIVKQPGKLMTPDLLQVSKAFRKDTFEMYYGRRNFHIIVRMQEFEHVRVWLDSINATCKALEILGINDTYVPFEVSFKVTHMDWDALEYMLPLARTALVGGSAVVDFPPRTRNARNINEALREIILLGLQARDEGCDLDGLEERFEMWLARLPSRGDERSLMYRQIQQARYRQEDWAASGKEKQSKDLVPLKPAPKKKRNRQKVKMEED